MASSSSHSGSLLHQSEPDLPDEQTSFLPKLDPFEVIAKACEAYEPVSSWCMFSGGNDSTVLAHLARDHYDGLCFIDTGTGVNEGPGFSVTEFVEEFAAHLGKPLRIMSAGNAFEKLVMELGGFPGPAGHGRAFTRLKERQIEALVKREKVGKSRLANVMLLTGKRRAESARRSQTTKGIEKRGGQLYVNPLIDWTKRDMVSYRREHKLPESPVAAMLGMSGECGCGAFRSPGEWEMRSQIAPRWAAGMTALEQRAEAAGVHACRWGGFDKNGKAVTGEQAAPVGALCDSCVWQQLDMDEEAPRAA